MARHFLLGFEDDAQRSPKSALKRDRGLVVVGLAGLIALSWSYLVPTALDMYGSMSGPSAWMMAATWDAPYFALVFVMWCVMMAGMMLPSAAPMILLFAKAVRRSAPALIAGFVLLEKLAPFGPQAGRIGGALLVAAGVWLLSGL